MALVPPNASAAGGSKLADTTRLNRDRWHRPLLSIIVTHHNYSDYLKDALLSILDQTYGNWECLVVDDASDPHHLARLGQILEGFPRERFRLLMLTKNAGQVPAFFDGLDQTSGEFVCLLDPDDRYETDFLMEMVEAHLNETVFCPVACCDQKLLKNGSLISRVNCRQKMRFIKHGIVPVHRQRVGRVQEVEMFGGKLLRIDIPTEGGDVTEFYGCSSIYALRPIAEDVARDAAKRYGDPRPVRPVEYRALPKAEPERDDCNDDDDPELPL